MATPKMRTNIEVNSYVDIDGTIDEAVRALREAERAALKEGYTDLRVEVESEYEGSAKVVLRGAIMETMDQATFREEREAAFNKRREDQERKQLADLKRKFGEL